MKAITVRNPWAWAIMHGGKDVENRSRNIAGRYRGPLVVHAGLAAFEKGNMASEAHRRAHGAEVPTELHFGAGLGVVDLIDVHNSDECWDRDRDRLVALYYSDRPAFDALPDNGGGGLIGKVRPCSPWAVDGWHLVLANPRPFPKPIQAKGFLGLWEFPSEAL